MPPTLYSLLLARRVMSGRRESSSVFEKELAPVRTQCVFDPSTACHVIPIDIVIKARGCVGPGSHSCSQQQMFKWLQCAPIDHLLPPACKSVTTAKMKVYGRNVFSEHFDISDVTATEPSFMREANEL